MATRARVKFKGPLFKTQKRIEVMAKMKRNILTAITKVVHSNVTRILKQKIRNPTPIYQTHILLDNKEDDRWRVTDQGLEVYNHWLEGTGSRNFPVTSFKGYHAFERAYAIAEKRALRLAQTQVSKAVKSLGGRARSEGGDDGDA